MQMLKSLLVPASFWTIVAVVVSTFGLIVLTALAIIAIMDMCKWMRKTGIPRIRTATKDVEFLGDAQLAFEGLAIIFAVLSMPSFMMWVGSLTMYSVSITDVRWWLSPAAFGCYMSISMVGLAGRTLIIRRIKSLESFQTLVRS